jgi:hypothetical protein
LAHGPQEKFARAGRTAGKVAAIITILSDARLSLGKGVPRRWVRRLGGLVKRGPNTLRLSDSAVRTRTLESMKKTTGVVSNESEDSDPLC